MQACAAKPAAGEESTVGTAENGANRSTYTAWQPGARCFLCSQVNLEGQRSTEERPSVGYPDISFAVEDFDDAFKSLVGSRPVCMPLLMLQDPSCALSAHPIPSTCRLQSMLFNSTCTLMSIWFCPQILTEPGWCYVVSLSATGGMALAAMSSINSAADAGTGGSGAGAKRSLSGATSLEERLAALNILRSPSFDELYAIDTDTGAQQPEAGKEASEQQPQGASPPQPQEAAHDDPLRRSTASAGSTPPQAARREDAAGPLPEHGSQREKGPEGGASGGSGASQPVDVQLFTGFVSYEQLETVLDNGWERRAAAKREMMHWIKMRGPGETVTAPPSPLHPLTTSCCNKRLTSLPYIFHLDHGLNHMSGLCHGLTDTSR